MSVCLKKYLCEKTSFEKSRSQFALMGYVNNL